MIQTEGVNPHLLGTAQREALAREREQALASVRTGGRCIHQLFLEQAQRRPGLTAVIDGEERISYAQLAELAAGVAAELGALGVGAEALVGVCARRTWRLVAALLGVLEAGAAYVPLDPAYPADRLALMLEDSLAAAVIAEHAVASVLPQARPRAVWLDEVRPRAMSPGASPACSAANLAYVIYTSGSTGRPKGVAVEHRSAVALIEWALACFDRTELSGVLASTSICFDLSVFELFATLAAGGTIVLAQNALQLPELPARDQVRLVNTVPSALGGLLTMGGMPSSVSTINLAGEPLRRKLVDAAYALPHVRKVYNLYGPTEDTVYSTWALVERHDSAEPHIGRPIPGTWACILDEQGRPVPDGQEGELCLGGAGLARGYLGRPELTAERFIPDPLSHEPGPRVYRTGDLARRRPDGCFECLGRIDHQVKVHGYRIELGEIESLLLRDPAVDQAVVVAREDADDVRLVAYVAPRPGGACSWPALRQALAHKLPAYTVPAAGVVLDSLPLLANGKIDRGALPEPDVDGAFLPETAGVQPADAVEQRLVEMWRKLLRVPAVGTTDNFFAVGGNSLLAVRLLVDIQKEFGVDVGVTAMWYGATIADLARHIREDVKHTPSSGLVPLCGGSGRPFFCVASISGNVFNYGALANSLSGSWPFYGWRPPGVDDPRDRLASVEEMAARAVQEMREAQPHGPYTLGGYSYGGALAYEAAQQLRAAGQEVWLAMLDDGPTHWHHPQAAGLGSLRGTLANVPWWLRVYVQRARRGRLGGARFELAVLRKRLRTLRRRRGEPADLWDPSELPDALRASIEAKRGSVQAYNDFLTHQYRAVRSYQLRPFEGRLTLFRARAQPLLQRHDPSLGWAELVPRLEVCVVPGSHTELLLEPDVLALAKRLSDWLAGIPHG